MTRLQLLSGGLLTYQPCAGAFNSKVHEEPPITFLQASRHGEVPAVASFRVKNQVAYYFHFKICLSHALYLARM